MAITARNPEASSEQKTTCSCSVLREKTVMHGTVGRLRRSRRRCAQRRLDHS